jgi:hypothetical protein
MNSTKTRLLAELGVDGDASSTGKTTSPCFATCDPVVQKRLADEVADRSTCADFESFQHAV